ncbi:MAG: quaternary ammonium compound-resistance protein SugE [Candidatus Marinimicrobia bacterium CG08_land_8_20_14_0_20_45_22]|nr:MAG: quaternary ammonium compound-resistance protein SugE [Candidatus Marinimicrobia bacterium CG08_land_8_20_14_0_20_45_22]
MLNLSVKLCSNASWIILIIAGLFEVVWAVGMKYTEGFSRLIPSIYTITAMFIIFGLLSMAIRIIPIGTAYAVWTGIGVVGTAMLGILLFHEPATLFRIVCIVVILSGIVGLKLANHF